MNKKNIIFPVILALFILLCSLGLALIYNNSNIRIKSYDAKVNIDSYGNMEVTETWIIKYPNDYSVRFRDIPYNKNHSSNPLVRGLDYSSDQASFDKNSVSIEIIDLDEDKVLSQGSDYEVGYSFNYDHDELGHVIECDPYSSTCESLFVNLGEGNMKGTKAFTYTYTINGAVTSFDDFSELNWVMFNYAESKVKSATIEVHLPVNAFDSNDLYAWGHGTSDGKIKIIDNQNVLITCHNIKTSDNLEIRIAFKNDLVNNISDIHKISGLKLNKVIDYEEELAKESNRQWAVAMIINVVTVIMVLLTIFMFFYTYIKFDKEYKAVFDKEYLREPPSEKNPADLGYLMRFGKTNDLDVTATILDLINRGVLVLSDKGYEITSNSPDFDISLSGKNVALLKHEQEVVNFFINVIGNGKSVNTKDIEKYGKKESEANKLVSMSNNFVRSVKNEFQGKNYFENAKQKAMSKHGFYGLVIGLVALLFFVLSSFFHVECPVNYIILVILFVSFMVYLASIKKRTKSGNEEYAKWSAFKKFLEDFSHFEDYPMPSIIIWEHYLVYATTFGISDKVMEQLKVKLKGVNLDEDGATFMRGYYYHNRANNFFIYNTISRAYSDAKVRSISTIAAARSGSSGGNGHGGGFSGGSSFGGGGGGGRSR